MASPSSMTHSIKISYKKIFDWQLQEEEPTAGELVGEPHLILCLRSEVNFEGDIISFIVKSRHRFTDCSSSFLNSFIKEEEPLPMDALIDPEVAEMMRVRISHAISYMVCSCIGVAGLKRLQVDVISKVYVEHQEDDHMGDEEVEDNVGILRERRMSLVQENVYVRDGTGTSSSASMAATADKELCAICLEEMVEGGKKVGCTPCSHQFHAECIGRWFEKSGFCPLCRFKVGP